MQRVPLSRMPLAKLIQELISIFSFFSLSICLSILLHLSLSLSLSLCLDFVGNLQLTSSSCNDATCPGSMEILNRVAALQCSHRDELFHGQFDNPAENRGDLSFAAFLCNEIDPSSNFLPRESCSPRNETPW